MTKKRSIKVYGQSGYKYRETSTITLKDCGLKKQALLSETIFPSPARTADLSSLRTRRGPLWRRQRKNIWTGR